MLQSDSLVSNIIGLDWIGLLVLIYYSILGFDLNIHEHRFPSTMNQKGYLCLDKSSGKVIMNRHIIFNESCFPFIQFSSNPFMSYGPFAIIYVPITFLVADSLSIEKSHFLSLSSFISSLPFSVLQNNSPTLVPISVLYSPSYFYHVA